MVLRPLMNMRGQQRRFELLFRSGLAGVLCLAGALPCFAGIVREPVTLTNMLSTYNSGGMAGISILWVIMPWPMQLI